MTIELAIRWAFIAAWVIVLLLLLIALRRLGIEAKRVGTRAAALAENPLPLDFAKAEADLGRLTAAIDAFPPLLARAAVAIEKIRRPYRALRRFVGGFPGPTESGGL